MKILPFFLVCFLALHVHGQDQNMASYSTRAHLEYMRDVKMPIKLSRLTPKLDLFKEMSRPNIHVFEKSVQEMGDELQATISILEVLNDSMKMKEQTSADRELFMKVMSNKKLKKKYGKLWEQADKLAKERGQLEARSQFYTAGGLKILGAGMSIVRACDPNESDENRALAKERIEYCRYAFPVRGGFDNTLYRGFFTDHLKRAKEWLDKNDPYLTTVFSGKSGEEFLLEVYRDSKERPYISFVGYAEKRDSIVSLGWDAVKNSKDPIIVAARELIILMDENKKLQEKLDAKDAEIRSEMERAYFDVYGTRLKIINEYYAYDFDLDRYYD